MICPLCQAAALTSTIRPDTGVTPERPSEDVDVFYDPVGKRHHHDSNVYRTFWVCSNGHKLYRAQQPPCMVEGCGFGGQDLNGQVDP